ncbi:hypothetical protein ACPA0F_18365 [Solibacillus silvestris]
MTTTMTETFNENALIHNLHNINDSHIFPILAPNKDGKLERLWEVSKVYTQYNEIAYLFDHTYSGIDSTMSIEFSSSKVVAIFFREFNVLLFSTKYKINELAAACETLKIKYLGEVEEELLQALEEQADNMSGIFRSNLEISNEDLENAYKNNASYIMNEVLEGKVDDVRYNFISKSWFAYTKSINGYYRYLTEGTKYLRSKLERYEKEHKASVRETVLYRMARDRYIPELKKDPIVKKALKIKQIFNSELEKAITVWIEKHNGERIKVSKNLCHWHTPELLVGQNKYDPHVLVKDIKSIQHGHKTFKLEEE